MIKEEKKSNIVAKSIDSETSLSRFKIPSFHFYRCAQEKYLNFLHLLLSSIKMGMDDNASYFGTGTINVYQIARALLTYQSSCI